MIDREFDKGEAMLTFLEDELLASADEDVLAGSGAAALAERSRALVEAKLRPRVERQVRSPRSAPWRDRRGRMFDQSRDTKRRAVSRVLVASATARALVEPDRLATMSDDELDHLLIRLRTLGLLSDENNGPDAPSGS